MESNIVLSQIKNIKLHISREIDRHHWNDALNLVSLCANILYWSNPYYMDEDLEKSLHEISGNINISSIIEEEGDSNRILVYDGFGLNNRGLIQIYLKALCPKYQVTYVTFSHRANKIPDILSILENYQADVCYLKKYSDSKVTQIKKLSEIVKAKNIGRIICYCLPEDVVCTTLMCALEGKVERYRINLTDHAFWLGAGCVDHSIEFREYGANISAEYRNIRKDGIHLIPFYPIVNNNIEFQGYPFKRNKNQKIIFSGGLLYKTLGDNNRYYKMVDAILRKHDDVIFWYAGSGDDSQIQKLIQKYLGRVYLTAERSDLYALLQNIDIYLSTYPFSGGLMYQYAALAGKVPVTLKKDETTDGFLINQKNLNVEFDSEEQLYLEIDRLLSDEEYYQKRSKQMKMSVISEEDFNQNVWDVMKQIDCNSMTFDHLDTENFRNQALDRLSQKTYIQCFASEGLTVFRYYPKLFLQGWYFKIKGKVFASNKIA